MQQNSGVWPRENVEVCFRKMRVTPSAVMPRLPPLPRLRRGHELKGAPEL